MTHQTPKAPLSIQQEQEVYIRDDGTTFTRSDIFVKLSVIFRDSMLKKLKGPKLSVFLCIALHCGGPEMISWPSLTTIASETGYSNRAVITAVQELERVGLITVEHRPKNGGGADSNRYGIRAFATMGAGGSELGSLGVVNDVHRGSERSSQEEESMKKKPIEERAPGGAGAVAPAADAAHLVRHEERYMGNLVVVHYPEDLTFHCPACDEQQAWPTKRTNFMCVKCKEPLVGFELGNFPMGQPDWKPPKKPIAEKEKRVLGNLFGDCPVPLSTYPYVAQDRPGLEKIYHADPALLWKEVRFQATMNLKGQCPRQSVVHNGMVAAQNKLPATHLDKERDETQAERNAREATPVPAALSDVYERAKARARAQGEPP